MQLQLFDTPHWILNPHQNCYQEGPDHEHLHIQQDGWVDPDQEYLHILQDGWVGTQYGWEGTGHVNSHTQHGLEGTGHQNLHMQHGWESTGHGSLHI